MMVVYMWPYITLCYATLPYVMSTDGMLPYVTYITLCYLLYAKLLYVSYLMLCCIHGIGT